MKIDMQRAGQSAGINFSQLAQSGGSDPTQYLNLLRASGSVNRVGTGDVNGVSTVHYRAVIQLSRVVDRVPPSQRAAAQASVAQMEKLSGTSSLPIDVWIDGQHRVRREQFAFHISLPNGAGSVGGASTIDFVSFGPTPTVTPPPASQVYDATAVAAAGIKKATGSP
jgi:hypothetical protein